jgi:hypothetical protein
MDQKNMSRFAEMENDLVHFLATTLSNGLGQNILRQYEKVSKTYKNTGCGFIIEFKTLDPNEAESIAGEIDDFGCIGFLNNHIMVDFVLHFDKGVVDYLEGTTFDGSDWPKEINEYRFQSTPSSSTET